MTIEIFDKHPEADAYRVGGFYSPYCLVSRDKRFSEAELAAEWHANESKAWQLLDEQAEFFNVDFAETLIHGDTFRRFATLPHFDA